MPSRYAIREVDPDKWTIYDIFTGQAARLHGKRMEEMEVWEAKEITELMNLRDLTRRGKSGISGPWL